MMCMCKDDLKLHYHNCCSITTAVMFIARESIYIVTLSHARADGRKS